MPSSERATLLGAFLLWIDEGGLEFALKELASSTSRLSGISCSFACVGQVEIRDNAQAVHFFRIAQEALNNAIKHGHPKAVVVALEASNGALSLRVSDDGGGFDPSGSEKKGMGLNIMRYRARMLAGTLETQSNSPVGTMVTCTIARPPAPAGGSNSTGHVSEKKKGLLSSTTIHCLVNVSREDASGRVG